MKSNNFSQCWVPIVVVLFIFYVLSKPKYEMMTPAEEAFCQSQMDNEATAFRKYRVYKNIDDGTKKCSIGCGVWKESGACNGKEHCKWQPNIEKCRVDNTTGWRKRRRFISNFED